MRLEIYKNCFSVVITLKDAVNSIMLRARDSVYTKKIEKKKQILKSFKIEGESNTRNHVRKQEYRISFFCDLFSVYLNKVMARVMRGDVYIGRSFQLRLEEKKYTEYHIEAMKHRAYIREVKRKKAYKPLKSYYKWHTKFRRDDMYRLDVSRMVEKQYIARLTLGNFIKGKPRPKENWEKYLSITPDNLGKIWRPHPKIQEVFFPTSK